MRYILFHNCPIPEPDLLKWGRWMDENDRRVRWTEVGTFSVSTVFLGLDHRFTGEGPPLLFETMVFNGDFEDLEMHRYSTWDEAVLGHEDVVRKIEKMLEKAKIQF